MPRLVTADPDMFQSSVSLVLLLSDAFRHDAVLLGDLDVVINSAAAYRKDNGGTFIFNRLSPGLNTVKVTSAGEPPYYKPATIPVTLPLPDPKWPGFPDRSIEQSNPAVYRQQVSLATLRPTVQYPFPADATLARGRVLAGGAPLSGATVQRDGAPAGLEYVTEADGQYVVFFDRVKGVAEDLQLRARAPGRPDALVNVRVVRGETVSADIAM